MFIQCPLDEQMAPRVEELVALGADEFYLGYRNRLNFSEQILTRRAGIFPNFTSISSTTKAICDVKKTGKKVFAAINETFYPPQYTKTILKDMAVLKECGVDGFIIADVNLFLKIQEKFPDLYLIASTVAHIFNSKALDFFKKLGARRCILPRQLTLHEIKEIVNNNRDMGFEVFVKNEECFNIDGLCAYSHFDRHADPVACWQMFENESICSVNKVDRSSCGVCALYDLKDFPRLTLKIVGRGKPYGLIKNDVAFVKQVLLFLDRMKNEEEFTGFCRKKFFEIYGKSCEEKCYYTKGEPYKCPA